MQCRCEIFAEHAGCGCMICCLSDPGILCSVFRDGIPASCMMSLGFYVSTWVMTNWSLACCMLYMLLTLLRIPTARVDRRSFWEWAQMEQNACGVTDSHLKVCHIDTRLVSCSDILSDLQWPPHIDRLGASQVEGRFAVGLRDSIQHECLSHLFNGFQLRKSRSEN